MPSVLQSNEVGTAIDTNQHKSANFFVPFNIRPAKIIESTVRTGSIAHFTVTD